MTRFLLFLNGLAILGAVANHALGWGFTSLFFWTDRYESVTVPNFSQLGSGTYYSLRALEQLVTPSLPVFLVVSGYFVAFAAGRSGAKLGWDKVGSRVRMLLIPYLVWSLAIMVGRGFEGVSDTSVGYVQQLLFGRAAEPYYYIPLIIQLYLLSPLIVPEIKQHWKPALLTAYLIQTSVQAARYPVVLGCDVPVAAWITSHFPGWFFPHMVFWFVFGVYAGFNLSGLKVWMARWKPVLPWMTLVLGVLGLIEWELLLSFSGRDWMKQVQTPLDTLYSLSFILTFMAFAESKLTAMRPLDLLGERSLGVYLIHAPVLELVSRAAYHLLPPLLAYQLLFQPLLIAAGVGVPLLLMAIVKRSPARPCYNYLFG